MCPNTDIIFLYLLWKHEKRVIQLRQRWFQQAAEDDHLYARSLSASFLPVFPEAAAQLSPHSQIIRIPEELEIKSDDDLSAIVSKLGLPHPTASVRLGRAMGSLPSLVKEHDESAVKLEKVLTKYLKGGQLGKKRPLVRLGGWSGCRLEESRSMPSRTTLSVRRSSRIRSRSQGRSSTPRRRPTMVSSERYRSRGAGADPPRAGFI
jgi:hypothetical protein